MPFPSTISTFVNPSPNDRLSTTPHSAIETAQNTALTEIENFIGAASSIQGTLQYDIRSPNSSGGGHVQAANVGGTGQTTFNKGDILVAQSSSVLTKLTIGADGTVPTANSQAATGISWQGVANATNIQNQTYTYARASVMSASVYGINLSQAVSVLTDGMGFVVKFPTTNTTSVLALTVNATGPSSVTALIKRPDLTNVPVGGITASMVGIVEFDSVSSVFQIVAPSLGGGGKFVISAVKTGGYPSTSGANRYFYPFDTTAPEASEGPGWIAPCAGTIKNLYIYLSSIGSTSANSAVLGVNKNTVGSGLSIVVDTTATPSPGVFSDTTHTAAVAAGDKITFLWAGGNSTDTVKCVSVEFDPS